MLFHINNSRWWFFYFIAEDGLVYHTPFKVPIVVRERDVQDEKEEVVEEEYWNVRQRFSAPVGD